MPAEYFRAIIDCIGDPVFVKDRHHRLVFANDAACGIFGKPLDRVLGRTDHDLFPKEQADVFTMHDERVFETGEKDINEEQITDARGDVRTIVTSKTLYRNEAGEKFVVGVIRDITERKAAEEVTLRLNRELRAVSGCNQTMLRATDEQTLLEDICRIVCEEAGYRMAWVGYAENDEEKTVRSVAWAGVEDGYLAAARMTWADTGRGQNATGLAIREGKPFCVQDVTKEPRLAMWKKKGLERGYRSNSAFPLKDEEGNTFGALTIYSTEPDSFTPVEMRLLEGLATDLAFGIVVLRARAERAKVEEALRASESRLSQAMDLAKIVYWEYDWDNRIFTFNDAFYAFHGTTAEKEGGYLMTGRDYGTRFVHPDDVPIMRGLAERVGAERDPEFVIDSEHRIIRGDGEIRHIIVRMRGFRDEEGRIVRCFGADQDVTERKRLEDAVALAEAKYRSIFENSVTGIFQTTIQGRVVSANPAFARMLGYDSPEELMTSVTDVAASLYVNRDDRTRLEALCREHGSVEGFEMQFYKKDGSMSWTSLNATIIKDVEGRAVGFEGTAEDVTERKRTAEALRESEQRYRALVETTSDWIWETDRNARYTYVSPRVRDILGYEPEEVIGTTPFDFIDAHEKERVAGMLEASTESLEPLRAFENVNIHRSGRKVVLETSAVPIFDAEGRFSGHRGVDRDVTERKKSEDELRQSRQQLMNIIDFLPDATFVIDKDKKVIAWNKACEEMTGVKKSEILGKGDHAYAVSFYGEPRPILVDYVTNDSDTLPTYTKVKRIGNRLYAQAFVPRLRGGRGGTIAGHASLLFDTEGNVVGAIESVRDMTDYKRLEDEFFQSQKMESVGRLAGGVAHDFNNMLTVVLGYTELAMSRYGPSEQIHSDLKTIQQAALQSAGLVRQLLAFARKQTVAPQILDLNDTVAGMLKMLRRLIGEDIDFAWMPGADLWPVEIDPSQVDQLLANLCVNARDAITGVGKVVIETDNVVFDQAYCDIHAGFVPGEYVMLGVSDNGSGMDQETVAQVFEPFFTTKEKGRGTGLGLATVYGIVKQNGGFIHVYSEPGAGSTFKVYLPCSRMQAAEPVVAVPPEIPGARGETVLIVEDDTAILALSRVTLQQLGYTVLAADTPAEALRLTKDGGGKIDLLVTDVVMPGMNGRDLARRLGEMVPGLKYLFVSGYTANVIVHHGVLDEGVQFLEKPFSVKSLATKVREVLDRE